MYGAIKDALYFDHLDRIQAEAADRQALMVQYAGAQALPLPGTAIADLRDAWARVSRRLGKLERGVLPYIASGVFVATLARFGLGWLRCDNVKRVGRGVCRLDAGQFDELLAGTLLVLSPISLAVLAEELAEVVEDVSDAVVWFAGGPQG